MTSYGIVSLLLLGSRKLKVVKVYILLLLLVYIMLLSSMGQFAPHGSRDPLSHFYVDHFSNSRAASIYLLVTFIA